MFRTTTTITTITVVCLHRPRGQCLPYQLICVDIIIQRLTWLPHSIPCPPPSLSSVLPFPFFHLTFFSSPPHKFSYSFKYFSHAINYFFSPASIIPLLLCLVARSLSVFSLPLFSVIQFHYFITFRRFLSPPLHFPFLYYVHFFPFLPFLIPSLSSPSLSPRPSLSVNPFWILF